MRKQTDHPQLLSTSRHITQGLIDVVEQKWDAASNTLRGKSRVVGGDPYELRIALPAGGSFKAVKATADGADIRIGEQTAQGVRVVIDTKKNTEVSWSVGFTK